MAEYYFDIETEGKNPEVHKIVTIQFQKLDTETGKPLDELQILKEWISSEENILREFLAVSKFDSKDTHEAEWNFVPIGENLIGFDLLFLRERLIEVLGVRLPLEWLIRRKAYLDIKPILIVWNRGYFKNFSLTKFMPYSGDMIPKWYKEEQFEKIIDYVRCEARTFLENYQRLKEEIPKIKLRSACG